MNCLSREAFAQGADWVFLLDADEFLDVPDRGALERYLHETGSDLIMAPWINLVPSHYDRFGAFDPAQPFRWSGRTSKYAKVALSSLFAANNPDYFIHEGNHSVSRFPTDPPILDRPGPPLLHVPIRSLDQFRYKIGVARRLMAVKHNRLEGEGVHVDELGELLFAGSVEPAELNSMAAAYGEPMDKRRSLDPEELEWPVKRLPAYVAEAVREPSAGPATFLGLSETLLADARTHWEDAELIKGTPVAAMIRGRRLSILPQPVAGSGRLRRARFDALGSAVPEDRPPLELLTDIAGVACMPVKAYVFSAWSALIPILYALFVVLRPRRYVELGVHNGMSFFAACQVAERLALETECVAVDSWLGDEHASFHDPSVFEEFRAYLAANYPQQHYIRAYFAAARQCFEDGSVDLLHIDGLHTYEAVKDDFETWLPKLSDTGVVILHDINVHERGFGVWRLWEELRCRYPSFGFAHQHGLGILYVGSAPHPVAALLRLLATDHHYGTLAQAIFAPLGKLLIEHRANQGADGTNPVVAATNLVPVGEPGEQTTSLEQQNAALAARLGSLQIHYDAIVSSSSWRITAPLRKLLTNAPLLRRFVKRAARLVWWTVTGQLVRRLRVRSRS